MAAAAPSSYRDIEVKRLRRQFEPTSKAWDDEALEITWEEVGEGQGVADPTLFAMRNILFFPCATAVQAKTIPLFRKFGNSVVVEAATGSGKTVAFLVPVIERILKSCHDVVKSTLQRPLLCRSIPAIILSPSGVLAQQTYTVARSLLARFPFGIQVALCDSSHEPIERTLHHLKGTSRGGGILLITTPRDLATLMDQIDSESERYLDALQKRKVKKEQKNEGGADDGKKTSRSKRPRDHLQGTGAQVQAAGTQLSVVNQNRTMADRVASNDVLFEGLPYCTSTVLKTKGEAALREEEMEEDYLNWDPEQAAKRKQEKEAAAKAEAEKQITLDAVAPVTVVIDEADVVLRSETSKKSVLQCLRRILSSAPQGVGRIDLGLFGATVSSADEIAADFLQELGIKEEKEGEEESSADKKADEKSGTAPAAAAAVNSSKLTFIVSGTQDEFISKLRNCVHASPPDRVIESLLHIINLHATKKHFVFFNNPEALLFIHKVLLALLKPTKPLLHIPTIFVLHEGLTDQQKLSNYNGFIKHSVVRDNEASFGSREDPSKADGGGEGGDGKGDFRPTKLKKAIHKNNQQLSHAMRSTDFSAKSKAQVAAQRGAILLCTDFAAFGLDVRDVDYVYHFDLPLSTEAYVHRIGRVARMGMRGTSVLLLPLSRVDSEHFQNIKSAKFGRKKKVRSKKAEDDDLIADTDDEEEEEDEEEDIQSQNNGGDGEEVGTPGVTSATLQEYKLPPSAAPLSSTIRSIVTSESEIAGLAVQAAKKMVKEFVAAEKKQEIVEGKPEPEGLQGLYPRADPTPLQLVMLEGC